MKTRNTIFGIVLGIALLLVLAAVNPTFIGNLSLTGNMTGNNTNSITNVANIGSPATVYYGSALNMTGISGSGLTALGGKGSNNTFFNPANTNASFFGTFQGNGTNAPQGFVWTATDSSGHTAFMASQGGVTSTYDPGTFSYNAGGGTNAAGLSNNLVAAIGASLNSASNLVNGSSNYAAATYFSSISGQGSNGYFSGMTSTNQTNSGGLTMTNLNGSGSGVHWHMGNTLYQIPMFVASWGGNPDAWEWWASDNITWAQDTNSQHIYDMTNVTDSVGFHGNFNVDSNFFVGGSATVSGNISAANIGTAAGSNAMQFVGSVGGSSSNQSLSAPNSTNLTEQSNLIVKGKINNPHFEVDGAGNLTNGGNATIGGNFTGMGIYNKFQHPQSGQEQLDINTPLGSTDTGLVLSGSSPFGYNYPAGFSPHFQSQYQGGLNVAFIYHNITNVNGSLATLDNLFAGPTWDTIIQTAATNSTVTLPTSTNWSMSIWGGNAVSRASTLFGSNTCVFDVLNDGGGIETVCTYDHAPFHLLTNGSYVAVTNPSISPGQFMLLAYGGSNGTSIINLANTYAVTTSGGGAASSFNNSQFFSGGGNTNLNTNQTFSTITLTGPSNTITGVLSNTGTMVLNGTVTGTGLDAEIAAQTLSGTNFQKQGTPLGNAGNTNQDAYNFRLMSVWSNNAVGTNTSSASGWDGPNGIFTGTFNGPVNGSAAGLTGTLPIGVLPSAVITNLDANNRTILGQMTFSNSTIIQTNGGNLFFDYSTVGGVVSESLWNFGPLQGAWALTVTSNKWSLLDVNSQHVFDWTNITDSGGFHGNVNFDSNATVNGILSVGGTNIGNSVASLISATNNVPGTNSSTPNFLPNYSVAGQGMILVATGPTNKFNVDTMLSNIDTQVATPINLGSATNLPNILSFQSYTLSSNANNLVYVSGPLVTNIHGTNFITNTFLIPYTVTNSPTVIFTNWQAGEMASLWISNNVSITNQIKFQTNNLTQGTINNMSIITNGFAPTNGLAQWGIQCAPDGSGKYVMGQQLW